MLRGSHSLGCFEGKQIRGTENGRLWAYDEDHREILGFTIDWREREKGRDMASCEIGDTDSRVIKERDGKGYGK